MGNRDREFEHQNKNRELDHRNRDREFEHRNRDRELGHRNRDREFEQRNREVEHRERDREFRTRDGDRDRQSGSKRRRGEFEEDWRDVRVKDEPVSDSEIRRRDRHANTNDKYTHHHSSSKHRLEPDRERNRMPQPQREQRSRSLSRNRDRDRTSRPSQNRGDDTSSPPRRERPSIHPQPNRHGNNRSDQPPLRDREHSRHSNQQREARSRFDGPTERPAREKDWDNFFNPDTKVKVEDEDSKYGKKGPDGNEEPKVEKEKPNFGLSGKLTEETNTFRGVVIKYSEPPEARKPQRIRWRLYPFKGSETLPTMYIHRQSAYLLGRERKIADIPIDHPSCSKQHAAIQYRLMPYERSNGTRGRRIKPYIIDLESGNGTFVNGKQIETKRYVELFEKDVLKFGFSSREYVLLHEHSKDEPDDDEPIGNSPEVDEKVKIKAEKLEEDD